MLGLGEMLLGTAIGTSIVYILFLYGYSIKVLWDELKIHTPDLDIEWGK